MQGVFRELSMDVLSWPGNSPDMNPIENLWHLVGTKVNQMLPTSELELKQAVIRCWNHDITQEVIHALIDSMPKRIAAVIKAKGDSTKY